MCLTYLLSMFMGIKLRTERTSVLRKISGISLIILGVLFAVSKLAFLSVIRNIYGYEGDSNLFNNIVFVVTFLCGWGAFTLVCSKPYRVLWRRVSIFILYIIWTLLLIGGINPHPFSETQISIPCFVALCIIYYLKDMATYEFSKTKLRRF